MNQNSSAPTKEKIKMLKVSSPAFSFMSLISPRYTCDGENVNPQMVIEDIPLETKSLAIIVEDPDAYGKTWVHWLVWNISPSETIKWSIPPIFTIKEDSAPGLEGKNDFGNIGYDGPAPPNGKHRYSFRVYALDDTLELKRGSLKSDLVNEMDSHIIGFGELVGVYGRVL